MREFKQPKRRVVNNVKKHQKVSKLLFVITLRSNMFFYIIVIIITTSLYYLCECKSRKEISLFTFVLFVLFPSVVEGCRDTTVGTDMNVYGVEYFINAKYSYSFGLFIKSLESKEYAYHILNYICSKFGDINLFLFVVAAMKMTLVGLTALHFRNKFPTWIFILCYLLFFYVNEFSLMRQGLAVAVCCYSLTFFSEKKYIPFLLCVFIASLFHGSGVFMLFLYPIHYAVRMWPRKITMFAVVIFTLLYWGVRMVYVYVTAFLMFSDDKVEKYFNSGVESSKTSILIVVSLIIISYIVKGNDDEHENTRLMARISSLTSLLFLLLCYFVEVAFRISFYFIIPSLIFTLSYLHRTNIKRKMVYWYIIALFFLSIYIGSTHGLGGTLPYRSEILGI